MGTQKSDSESSYAYDKLQNASQLGEFVGIEYYCGTKGRTVGYVLGCVLTLGALYLVCRWSLKVKVKVRYVECAPWEAEIVVVRLTSGATIECPTRHVTASPQSLGKPSGPSLSLLLCDIQHLTYYLNPETDQFQPLLFPTNYPFQTLHTLFSSGIESEELLKERQVLYGPAVMDVPIPSVFEVFTQEVLHPFFMFQLFSVTLWFVEMYWIYAIVILVMSLASIVVEIVTTRENVRKIRAMAYYATNVQVQSGSGSHIVTTSETSTSLVPGEVIVLEQEWIVPCDVILLSGNCVVNEGLLTGESMPVMKEPMPRESMKVFDREEDGKHILYAGTRCIQVRGRALGLVISTGFSTFKGQIMRSILFPKANRLDFSQDSMRFVGILACISCLAFLISIPIIIYYGESGVFIVVLALDLVTISIPPALPLAMTVGTSFAMKRLEKSGVICISPSSINSAGSIDVICCDKTGTLTEDNMKFHGILPGNSTEFSVFRKEITGEMEEILSVCQSLSCVNGELLGDPQEISIAQALNLKIDENNGVRVVNCNGKRLKIVQIFHFNSVLKRMGVISQENNRDSYTLYMKGAPEIMQKLYISLPNDYLKVVKQHTRQGLRVLACGHKQLEGFNPRLGLMEVESGLEFDGLVMFRNELMQETPETVGKLVEAGYKVVIATGDSLLTGISVSYDSGVTPTLWETYSGEYDRKLGDMHWEVLQSNSEEQEVRDQDWIARRHTGDTQFAVATTGRSLSIIAEKTEYEDVLGHLLAQLRVCGRMSPDQKRLLVTLYQERNHMVAMCGDGANDCSALKASDVGLSVSYEEASIAAPFTGQSLSSLLTLFKEGKAALATSFQVFKFMALYAMIQLMSAFLLYCLNSNLTTMMFLYIDVVLVVPLIYVMSGIPAYTELTAEQLPRKLLSPWILISFFGQMIVQAGFLILTYLLELTQDWYSHDGDSISDPSSGYDNTVIFLVSSFQYLSTCSAFSIGPPFRQPAYRNWLFTGTVSVLVLANLYLLLLPAEWVRDLLDVTVYVDEKNACGVQVRAA